MFVPMFVSCTPTTLEVFTLHGDKDTPQASGTFLRDGKALHLEETTLTYCCLLLKSQIFISENQKNKGLFLRIAKRYCDGRIFCSFCQTCLKVVIFLLKSSLVR